MDRSDPRRKVLLREAYELIRLHDEKDFVNYLNKTFETSLPIRSNWECAFEVCFYRDIGTLRGAHQYSRKRTFDLCLLSEEAIVILEAKADQEFDDPKQLKSFVDDIWKVKKLTGVPMVVLVGLASSRYIIPGYVKKVFHGRILTWKRLVTQYSSDRILLRADEVYDPDKPRSWEKKRWGENQRNRVGSCIQSGKRFFVGRRGGINGVRLTNDIATGEWKSHRYETNPVAKTCPNDSWFSLEDFYKRISELSSE